MFSFSAFLINTSDRVIRVYDSKEIIALGKDGEPEPIQKLQDLVNKLAQLFYLPILYIHVLLFCLEPRGRNAASLGMVNIYVQAAHVNMLYTFGRNQSVIL